MQEVVQSVDRSLCILEALSEYEDGLGLKDISEKVDLHKSTVHRLLGTLVHKKYVVQDAITSKYMLTLKLFQLGSAKVDNLDMVKVSNKYLTKLMEETNEVVHLGVIEDLYIVYLSKVEPRKSIKMYTRIGMRKPLYCTAMGKSILAEMDEDYIDEIWKKSDIQVLTNKTIVKLDEFKEDLKKVKLRGYSMDDEEVERGIRCIGAKIRNHKGEICGSISVSGSTITLTKNKIESFGKLLVKCTEQISEELGYKK